MEFSDLQKAILTNAADYEQKYGVVIDEEMALLKFYEEAGEFAQAVLIHKKKCRPEKISSKEESRKHMSHELADVLNMVVIVADRLHIDLDQAVREKVLKETAR